MVLIIFQTTNLDCPEGFRIGMATFHPSIDKFGPNIEQILLLGTKHVDSLPTSDFAVKVVLLCDLANRDQPISRNLPTGNTRNDGERSIPLYIRKELVVCILEVTDWLIQNMAVIHARQNRSDGWLAQLTSQRIGNFTYCLHYVHERF